METRVKGEVKLVQVPEWEQFQWLRHGFSTRGGGVSTVYGGRDLNLGFTQDDAAEAVLENRRRFAAEVLRGGAAELACVRQVHGQVTRAVRQGETGVMTGQGRPCLEADGLMTDSDVYLLGIQVADCVPVLVADTRRRVVAAFHAGWRGTVASIVERGIAQMRADFGSVPEDLVGAVGPSIRACCYRVGAEVRDEFSAAIPYADELFSTRDNGLYLDLAAANRRQLLSAGLAAKNVTVLAECTGCAAADGQRKYFSHRMEQGFTGRMMAAIGIANVG